MEAQVDEVFQDNGYLIDSGDAFRDRTRSVLSRIVLPNAERWEKEGKIDRQGWRALGRQGFLGLAHSGPGFLRSAIFLDELGQLGYAGIRGAFGVHSYMALSYLELFGTDAQKMEYIQDARRGLRVAGLAISEANAGSNLGGLTTRAEVTTEGKFRINGEKCFIANGSQADFFVTLIATDDSSSASVLGSASFLIIDADLLGIERLPQPMLGWRSADICTLRFRDVLVPAECVLGVRGRAFSQLMKALDFERLVAGLLAVGGIGYCVQLLRAHIQNRKIGSSTLSAKQAIRQQVAELESDFALVRQYSAYAAWQQSHGRLDTRTASILKLKSTELAMTAAQKCLQIHGAAGYLQSSAASRLYRDSIGATIAAGPSELMRDMIYELG
jgi:alkylation response protein AidB-like acyl-CoA dehydrogenase